MEAEWWNYGSGGLFTKHFMPKDKEQENSSGATEQDVISLDDSQIKH
jgi:hypothetical protein